MRFRRPTVPLVRKPCLYCKKIFTFKKAWGKYCTLRCIVDDNVIKGNPLDCWSWKSFKPTLKHVRPKATLYDTRLVASRVVYEVYYQVIPKGMRVIHTCNMKWCVNPYHMILKTHSEQSKECVRQTKRMQKLAREFSHSC